MSDQKIPILDLSPQYQSLKPEIYAAIDRVLESGQFIMGPDVKQFEQEVATYLGVKHAIAVNSGTDALVIGLRAMGIGSGDEVITTPFSFFATAESISSVGATPIFVDIDPKTFNIDPAKIKDKITSRTKAIMPVHLYGNPAAMTQIMGIAQAHGLKVIEDCAQSFGARYAGNGDGGLIATNDDAIADLAKMLRVHGAKKKYHNEIIGYNSRLDTLQAAILRVKLPHIDEWNAGRRRVASLYTQLLADIPEVVAPEVVTGHVFHQYTIRILKGDRDKVASTLAAQGISTMIYYPIPQDQLPIYAGKYPPNPISDELGTQVLSLPIWPELDEVTITRIIDSLKLAIYQ